MREERKVTYIRVYIYIYKLAVTRSPKQEKGGRERERRREGRREPVKKGRSGRGFRRMEGEGENYYERAHSPESTRE